VLLLEVRCDLGHLVFNQEDLARLQLNDEVRENRLVSGALYHTSAASMSKWPAGCSTRGSWRCGPRRSGRG
jgi:hypothetical protein